MKSLGAHASSVPLSVSNTPHAGCVRSQVRNLRVSAVRFAAGLLTTKMQILCRLERILLRGFFALFASSRLIPDSAFTAKTRSRKENAKQIVWLRLGCLCVHLWFR